jgi:tripartite tricarboxylate transporter TctB family protein
MEREGPVANKNLVKGLFLIAIAAFFAIQAWTLPLGTLGRAGPGWFPLFVSCLLLVVGVAITLRSRFIEAAPLDLHVKNIVLIAGSLVAFVIVSEHVNMLAGIVAMVFIAAFAGDRYSAIFNLKVAVGLALVALAMHKALGFQLPLF